MNPNSDLVVKPIDFLDFGDKNKDQLDENKMKFDEDKE